MGILSSVRRFFGGAATTAAPAKKRRTNNGAGGRASVKIVHTCDKCGRQFKGPAFGRHKKACGGGSPHVADARQMDLVEEAAKAAPAPVGQDGAMQ